MRSLYHAYTPPWAELWVQIRGHSQSEPAWHDQFKTNVLAQAATFGLVPADTTPISTDNTDLHAKITNLNTTDAAAKQAVADKNISRRNSEGRARALAGRIKKHPAYTEALGNLLKIIGAEDSDDLAAFPPITATPYIDNRPLLVPGKPEIREYKAMFVVGDEEIGVFSHELVVNCAP